MDISLGGYTGRTATFTWDDYYDWGNGKLFKYFINFWWVKDTNFWFFNERINNKVNSWTICFLTKRENELIIKSVASAMLTHVMSCIWLAKQ